MTRKLSNVSILPGMSSLGGSVMGGSRMGGSVGCTYGAGAIIGASRMVTSMNKFAAPESHLSNMISEAGSAVNE